MWPLYLFAVCAAIILVLLAVHLLVVVMDLRNDGSGPADCCNDLNMMAPFDAVLQWLLSLCLLFTLHPFIFLWSLPFSVLDAFLYANRSPAAEWGYHNPLKFNRKSHLTGLVRLAIIKLGYQVVSLIIYTVCLIMEIKRR